VKATFHRLAEAELIAAARDLDTKAKLGHAFIDEYEDWEVQIRRFPLACHEIAPGIRCGYLKRFKYHVTYRVLSGAVRILYIRSARQEPLRHFSHA
jgi:hypothetical protein